MIAYLIDNSVTCLGIYYRKISRGMVRGGRWEEGSGWGTRVHSWRIHIDVWQNQYSIVK